MATTTAWANILEWFREDASISEWMDQTEFSNLHVLTEDSLKLYEAAFRYQGFDVKRLIKVMRTKYNEYTPDLIVVEIDVTVDGVARKFTFPNNQPMMKDMQFLIMLFATRGSSIDKITRKSEPNLKEILDILTVKYNLDPGAREPNKPLPPDTVTIPRIACCFPALTAQIFHKGYGRVLYTVADLHLPAGTSRALCTTFITSCLPRVWITQSSAFHYITFLAAVITDDVLHRKDKSFSDLSVIFTYYSAAYNSPAVPEASRAAFCVSFAISNPTATGFKAEILQANAQCAQTIRDRRPNDPDLEHVMAQLLELK